MDTILKRAVHRNLPWLGLTAELAVTLGAFWFLLSYRYSPEKYVALPTVPYAVEFGWYGLSILGVVIALVVLRRDERATRGWLRASLPVAAYSCVILVKTAAVMPLGFYDMILFSAALGWAAGRGIQERAGRSAPNPTSEPAWTKWAGALVWMAVGLFGLYYFFQQAHYWNNLTLGYADCGENARLMLNTVCNPRELFLRVNPDKPLFYDHFDPGILPLTPLWWLWPDLRLTIALQIVAIVGSAVPVYLLGKLILKDQIAALLLALCWLAYPSVSQFVFSGTYGFRWGNVCLLMYFVGLVLWLNGRPGWALAMAIWAVLIKEEAAVIIGMFGVYLALFERRRWSGLMLAAGAFGFFLLITSVIVPKFSSTGYSVQRFFADLGDNKCEILLSPLLRPAVFWGRLFDRQSFGFALTLLAPLLFVPLRKPCVLFVGLLTFIFDCLHPILKSICFQYQAALLPVLFWAFAEALRESNPLNRRALLAGSLTTGVVASIFLGNTFWSKDTLPLHLWPGRLAMVRQMTRGIDRDASMFATQRIAAHFITQKYLYLDPPLPPSIDYVLLDLRDSWRVAARLDWLTRVRAIQRQAESLPDLHLVNAEDGIVLYARKGTPLDARALVERDSLPQDVMRDEIDLGQGVRIAGFTITAPPFETDGEMKHVIVTTFSRIEHPTRADVAVQCLLRFSNDTGRSENYGSEIQPLGQGIWPVERWLSGKLYEDRFIVQVAPDTTLAHLSVAFEGTTLPR